jgi:hypothetical protein
MRLSSEFEGANHKGRLNAVLDSHNVTEILFSHSLSQLLGVC